MNAAKTIEWLTSLRNRGSSLGLARMGQLAARLHHPERAIPCFHIAGTNGKGSTSAMIEVIQRGQGRRTGLYTSPHLIEIGERIRINREPTPESQIVAGVKELRPHYEAMLAADPNSAPTFFELMTALAWREFQKQKVDVVILETGMGGRLDATNVCQPEVTVITSIGLDHQEYLGNTIELIAAEKAGIIKPGVPCVLSRLPPSAEQVIVKKAQQVGAPIYRVRDRFGKDLPEPNLRGEHQRWNAGAALLACELATRFPIVTPVAHVALQKIAWPARWQTLPLSNNRTLIVDGSHNEEGIRMTEPLLAQLKQPTVIVGALGLDRAQALVEVVSRYATEIIFVQPNHERACSVEDLKRVVPKQFTGKVTHAAMTELFPAPQSCRAPGKNILVIGSLYLAGEVLAHYHGKKLSGHSLQDRLH